MSISLNKNQGSLINIFQQDNGLFAITNKGNIQLYDLLSNKTLGFYGIDYSEQEDLIVPITHEFLSANYNHDSKIFIFGTQLGSLTILMKT